MTLTEAEQRLNNLEAARDAMADVIKYAEAAGKMDCEVKIWKLHHEWLDDDVTEQQKVVEELEAKERRVQAREAHSTEVDFQHSVFDFDGFNGR